MSEQHDHVWVYRGVVYEVTDVKLPGSGACYVYYHDLYFCNLCLETRTVKLDTTSDTYSKLMFNATPLPQKKMV